MVNHQRPQAALALQTKAQLLLAAVLLCSLTGPVGAQPWGFPPVTLAPGMGMDHTESASGDGPATRRPGKHNDGGLSIGVTVPVIGAALGVTVPVIGGIGLIPSATIPVLDGNLVVDSGGSGGSGSGGNHGSGGSGSGGNHGSGVTGSGGGMGIGTVVPSSGGAWGLDPVTRPSGGNWGMGRVTDGGSGITPSRVTSPGGGMGMDPRVTSSGGAWGWDGVTRPDGGSGITPSRVTSPGGGMGIDPRVTSAGGAWGWDLTTAVPVPDSTDQLTCSFVPDVCRPGKKIFHLVQYGTDGCPVDSCQVCSPETKTRPECSGVKCPAVVAPVDACRENFFLSIAADAAGCPVLACAECSKEQVGKHPGCRCPPVSQPVCPTGQFAKRFTDAQGCVSISCIQCPSLTPPRCPSKSYVKYTMDPNGCPAMSNCVPCTTRTANRPECQDAPRGCTEANKPQCANNLPPAQQLLGTVCTWVCGTCPSDLKPVTCQIGQYMQPNLAGQCQPWTCRDCDYQHRDLPACRSAADTCPALNWAVACSAGQFRRARGSAFAALSDCLEVECASCEAALLDATAGDSGPSTNSSLLEEAAAELPAECRHACPQPLVLCQAGATVEISLDAFGCQKAVCRPCRDQDACGAQPNCARRGQLDHDADDCRQGLFYLGSVRIDGCAATVCLPCPAALAAGEERPPGCQELPATCAAVGGGPSATAVAAANAAAGVSGQGTATAGASAIAVATVGSRVVSAAKLGLPNCTFGAQRVEQRVDASGCPSLACAECPASRPACPPGTRESPRPTKWLQCQLFDCKPQSPSVRPGGSGGGSGGGLPPTLVPVDPAGCPKQSWLQLPVEFGTEFIEVDGVCRLRTYRPCPDANIRCPRGEQPVLTGGNCEYTCQTVNGTAGSGDCFPGQHYLVFVIDVNRAKSPFQIRFQVASFISRLASQMSYGVEGVQIGALLYSGRIVNIINPDECATPDAFFRRLLLLRYDEDASTATGDAVAASIQLLRTLKRADARRSLVVLTDSVTNSGRSLQAATALLPEDVVTYFVSLSSVWNPALRAEAEAFVSEPGNLVELTSYYLLATSGVQLLFPQCYRACDSARRSLALYQDFLRYLQDSVHTYEAWLYDSYTSIALLQEGLETMQYQFESKQIRLELCSRMIAHYKATVQRLQEQLDSLQVMRTQSVNVVDYESSLTQVKQLEQRIESLTVKKSQLVTQLQQVLVQISTVEERLVVLRKAQAEKLAAEEKKIAELESQITVAWSRLQTLTQELLVKRMAASNVESMVQEKETRIQDLLLLNADLIIRVNSVKSKITMLKSSGNSTQINNYLQAQDDLAKCEAQAALEGFSPLLTVRSGDGVRIQETVDFLLRGAKYSWAQNATSAEMLQYSSLFNFTVGTYSELKLVFRNSADQIRAYLVFRVAAYDVTNFFDSANLIACFPWRLESVKETLDLSWSLRSERFPSLLFAALMPEASPAAAAASGAPVATQCAGRKGILAMITDKDGCEDLTGPYPRLRFSPSGQPTTLAEMEELSSMQVLVKSLAGKGADANWLPGLIASLDMPVSLGELISNGMLAFAPELTPTALRPGLFFKSQLLRSRPTAFPLIRLRLTDSTGRMRQLVYNGTFERDRVVQSNWTTGLLTAARLFTADPAPFGFTIGDASPCEGANATGVLFFNLDNRCEAAADRRRGWSVLLSPENDRQVPWNQTERASYVEIQLRRRPNVQFGTTPVIPRLA